MKAKNTSLRRGLLAGGNWTIERIKLIDVYPQLEQLTNIREEKISTGGAAYNILITLAKSGAPFPLYGAGLVGKDQPGTAIIQDCKNYKIDVRYLSTTTKAQTAYTDVMTEKQSARRALFHFRGANALWDGAELDFSKIKARLFHLGYLLLLDALDGPDKKFGTKAAALLAKAQQAGLKTSIDVAFEDNDRFVQTVHAALKYVDYCILNEVEASKITGFKIREPNGEIDPVAVRHAAGALLQQGARELVVIHYPEGAFARTRKGEDVWQPALKLPQNYIVSTAGAGDAFCAGVLMGLHEGWDLQRCLLTGVCLAAACLSDLTSTGGIKALASSLALAKKFGFQPSVEKGD